MREAGSGTVGEERVVKATAQRALTARARALARAPGPRGEAWHSSDAARGGAPGGKAGDGTPTRHSLPEHWTLRALVCTLAAVEANCAGARRHRAGDAHCWVAPN